ncbi:hypothetical protein [Tenacibaculum sp. C7A-26P2]|uniref:hypothetical protein n=1 Tax=Tenacibaculum sp. C7A-26P2 TaxID=3447504 RepID=UPI003F84A6B7
MAKYKQTFNNSCGAASLMCAAIELKKTKIPGNTENPIHPLWITPHDIKEPNGDKQSEAMIYAITSGAEGAPSDKSGYSLPSRIGKVAALLGIHSIAFVPTTLKGNLLLYFYNTEKLDAQKEGMLLKREQAPVLKEGQFLLKILRVGAADTWVPAKSLHYVLERSDKTIMDPSVGQNFPDLNHCIKALNKEGAFYEDTGLAILLA